MHIGRCENCKYMDLVENVGSKCPRCGARMISLGVDSLRWNRMSMDTKNAIILEIFPEEAEPVDMDEPEEEIVEAPETREAAAAGGQSVEAGSVPESGRQAEGPSKEADMPSGNDHSGENGIGRSDKVYVCYKCNGITGHDGTHDRYFCTECGSEMVDVGYTVGKWADLSKEEKRKAAEDAKIRHMVTEIKKAKIDDSGESTPNIINVV